MNKKLHILNGDSTSQIFSKTDINGDVIIFREMLCDGPLYKDVGSDEFWKSRYTFFEEEMGISKIDYFDKTIKELIKIEDISSYDEVILWFEYDLFCQVNLMALCVYLLKYYKKNINYYLVCTGEEHGRQHLQALSDYSINEYLKLFKKKIKLSRNDLLFIQQCWEKYVINDQMQLKEFNFNKNTKFKYLQMAIDQHLQRFPSHNGLNQIENKIIEFINAGISGKKKIVKKLLTWQRQETVYGFGDQQYFLYLKKLHTYYSISNEIITLNIKGKALSR